LKLVAFKAKNFRCLLDTPWIPIHDLTVLIGENDGGKTATLDALSLFLSTNRKPDIDDFSTLGSKAPLGSSTQENQLPQIALEGCFQLTQEEIGQLPEQCSRDGNKIAVRRKFTTESQGSFLIDAMVHPDLRFSVNLSTYTVEVLKQLASEYSIEVPSSPKNAIVEAINNWIVKQELERGELELPPDLRALLPEFESFESASEPQSVVNQMLRRVYRDEITKDEIQGKLSEIERDIGSKLRSEAQSLKEYIQKYRERIEDITVDPRFNFEGGFQGADIKIKETDREFVNLDKSGTGMQHHVRLAVYEWNSGIIEKRSEEGAKPVIWAFDEPDMHLDYKCQRKLFDIIQGFVRSGVQVIICTHSINLVNRVPLQNLVHYSLDTRGCTEITTYELTSEDEDFFLHQIGANMGLDNSLMFYERCFVAVEGEMEMNCLPIMFETHTDGRRLITEGIRLINGEGNGGARLFAKFLNEKHKNVILLVDEDCKTNPPQDKYFTADKLQADGFDVDSQVYFAGPKEFEYLFPDEIWARVGNAIGTKKDDGNDWTASDITPLRSDPALKFAISLRRAFRVDTTRLAYTLSKCVGKEEIPETITKCFDHALQIANRGG
jgi:hypothetical protein